MKTRIALLGAGTALALTALLAFAPGASGAASDEAAIKKHSVDFAAAWNRHDPKAIAALWANDGDILNPWNRMAKGRAEVEKLFSDDQTGTGALRDSTFELKAESIRFATADVAVDDWEVSVTGAYDPDGSKHPGAMTFHCTMIRLKGTGDWAIYSGRPYLTAIQPIGK